MKFIRKLPIPQSIKESLPLDDDLKNKKSAVDFSIRNALTNEGKNFLIVVGPCSADREEPILEYTYRLKRIKDKLPENIIIVPRLFTTKPRTLGTGYTGISSRPTPSGNDDMLLGIIAARSLLLSVAKENGFFGADEILYPENQRYFSDLLSYATIGARSSEDQMHRMLASGLDIPIGMKNPPSGDISVMFNSIYSASIPHKFIYRGWEVESEGNKYAHAVIRGADYEGVHLPNYHFETLSRIADEYNKRDLFTKALIVDASHGNSCKNPQKQVNVCFDVLDSMKKDAKIKKLVKGFMIESYLLGGSQSEDGSDFGRSYTDPCLSWEETEELLLRIADKLSC